MKNKKLILSIIILTCLLIISAGTDVWLGETVTGTGVIPFKKVLIKFCLAMGAVLVSVFVIWIGLNIFKKHSPESFRNAEEKDLYSDTLETPKSVDEAIISFIDKNKL